jgi:hypothetical protein
MNLLIDSGLRSAFSGLISFGGDRIVLLNYNLICVFCYFIVDSIIGRVVLLTDYDLIFVFLIPISNFCILVCKLMINLAFSSLSFFKSAI